MILQQSISVSQLRLFTIGYVLSRWYCTKNFYDVFPLLIGACREFEASEFMKEKDPERQVLWEYNATIHPINKNEWKHGYHRGR